MINNSQKTKKNQMGIKILFFDFDGTISDAYSLAFKSLVKTLDESNHKYDKSKIKNLLGAKMPEIFKTLGIPLTRIQKFRKKFFNFMLQGVKNNQIKPCVSLKPLYNLKKQGYKLIIITNSEGNFIRQSIKQLKIQKLFNKAHTAENFSTKDKLLKQLFKKYKIKPHQAVYIGDRFSDIEYARKAGCYAIAIHNKCSWSTKTQILKEKPDFIIKDFYGLKKILNKLNKE